MVEMEGETRESSTTVDKDAAKEVPSRRRVLLVSAGASHSVALLCTYHSSLGHDLAVCYSFLAPLW